LWCAYICLNLEPGKGREIESKIKGGAIPKEFIPGVEKGVETVADGGILAGFPLIDYKVTIVDGLHHDVDSSVLAFEIASRYCLFVLICYLLLDLLHDMNLVTCNID
jgi:translation elongation factor EF-G